MEELEYIKNARYADWIYINGEVKFHNKFLENSIKVHPTFEKKANPSKERCSRGVR